ILATGARAARPDIPGLAEAGFYTNETIFTLTELPPRLAVLGGGPVGCELAQAFARFGAEVHLIVRNGRLLPRDDPRAGGILESWMRTVDGVRVHLDTTAVKVEPSPAGKVLRLSTGERIVVDAILVAVGRQPNVEGLDLEAAGVKVGERGVVVDDYL